MRIAFVCDAAYPWHVGGLEAVEYEEAKALAKSHEVYYFSIRWPGMGKDFVKDRVHYHTFSVVGPGRFYRHGRRSILTSLLFAINVLGIFRYRFDVINANAFPFLHLPALRLYCMLTGCRLVLDTVEVWKREYWRSYLGNALLGDIAYALAGAAMRSAAAYIAPSSTTASGLIAEGVPRDKVHIFSPVLDGDALSKAKQVQKAGRRVVFSGRFIKEKRIDLFIKAVSEARKEAPGITGLIIGSGPEEARIRAQIRRLGLEGVITVRPFYERKEDMYRAVASSSVFLHMSEREGLAIVVLESLALNVPVVLPSYSPIPKEAKGLCVVVPARDVPLKLAEMLKGGSTSRYIRDRRSLSRFYISGISRFYSSLFGKILKKGPVPGL